MIDKGINVRFGIGVDKLASPLDIFAEAFSVACNFGAVSPGVSDADGMHNLLHAVNSDHANEAAMMLAVVSALSSLLECDLKPEDTIAQSTKLQKRSDAALRISVRIGTKAKTTTIVLVEGKVSTCDHCMRAHTHILTSPSTARLRAWGRCHSAGH